MNERRDDKKTKLLMLASVASMIGQFNMSNIHLLQEMGYEVHVACNFKEGNTCGAKQVRRLQKTLRSIGVIQHQWDCPRNAGSVWKCVKAYRQLWILTGEYHFAWMHCHSPVGGVLARLVAHHRKIRVIYTAHGFHFYKGAPVKNWLLYYPVEKLLAYWTDVLITINQEDYGFAKRNLQAGKVYYIPGIGIDTEQSLKRSAADAKAFRKKYHIPKEAVLLLSVGELSRRKNHQAVLSVLPGLSRQDVYYMICGQGPCRRMLMQRAKALGIAERLRLPGFAENVWEAYLNADIFVFPSLQEGMPAALMEAMAAGMPCVVSDIRGNRELIDDAVQGIRFSPKHLPQLQKALEYMLADEMLRQACSRNSQKKIKAYDIAVVEQRMKRIYSEMDKKQDIKISVLLAVYNPKLSWLKQLIASIDHQTFAAHEVLILDDGSEAEVFEQVQKIVSDSFHRQKRVSLHRSSQNEGSNQAFEKLALMAEGDYLAFCDQDDIWEKEKLAVLAQAVRKENAVMAYSDMSVIDENNRKIYASMRRMRKCLRYVHGSSRTVRYLADNCTAGCSMMARADLVKKAVPFSRNTYCDQWVAAFVSAYGKVAFVDRPLVRYRRHSKNQTGFFSQIRSKQDYYEKRVLPMCRLVEEIRTRGVPFRQEKEAAAFAQARRDRDIRGIWKYRRCSKKYAYFDLLMICLPDQLAEAFLRMLRSRKK